MRIVILLVLSLFLAACGPDPARQYRGQAVARWENLRDAYRHRADLVPTLLFIMRESGARAQTEALRAVEDARAATLRYNISAQTAGDPRAFAKFVQRQSALAGSMERLLSLAPLYPSLMKNQNFQAIVRDLAQADARIVMAQQDYDIAVRQYVMQIEKTRSRWWSALRRVENVPMQSFDGLADREGRAAAAP